MTGCRYPLGGTRCGLPVTARGVCTAHYKSIRREIEREVAPLREELASRRAEIERRFADRGLWLVARHGGRRVRVPAP